MEQILFFSYSCFLRGVLEYTTAIHGIIHFKSGCKGTTSFANEQTTYILTKTQARQSSFFLFEVITDSAYLVNET